MPRPRTLCLIPTAILTLLIVSAWLSPWPSDYISTNRSSAYRQQLSTVRPLDRAPHSRTLGVAQRIYAIGLARRTDRREYMQSLIQAMDIDVEWYDALDMTSPLVTTILERVRWARSQSRIGHEKDIPNPQGLYFTWLPDVRSDAPVTAPAGIDLWFLPAGDPSALEPLPPTPSPDTRPPLLRTSGESNLLENEVISRAQVSCWYSHYQVLLKIAQGPDEVAIVLEDDVDMEWDLETRLGQMWPFLPEDWDIVMLGHCHSKEYEKPSVPGYPHLHPSTHVLCTHAYAISRAGARRLVRHIRSPLFAFSRPIDHVIQHFNHHKTLNIYSVEPPVVIQMKNTGSDIVGGIGQQNQWLVDSVMERVAYHQQLQTPRREDS